MKRRGSMIRALSRVLLWAILFQGCTTYHTYDVGSSGEYIAEINKMTETKKVAVNLINGDKYSASNLVLKPDSSHWYDYDEMMQMKYSNADINSIVYSNKKKGALEGFAIGAGAGAVFGIGLCTLMSLVMPGGTYSYPYSCAAVAGGIFALFGGILGLPIGASVGHTEVYMIRDMESR